MKSALIALAVVLLGACGGGGAEPIVFSPKVIDVGLVASTVPTVIPISVGNPSTSTATVEDAGTSGPFAFAPGALPRQLGAGASVTLDVVFTPPASGSFEGSAAARLTSGSGLDAVQLTTLHAQAEPVRIFASPTALSFGDVQPGDTTDRTIQVRNASRFSPTTISSVTGPSAAFSLITPALPLPLQPGGIATLTVRYAPTGPSLAAGNVTIQAGDESGATLVSIEEAASGGQEIVDLGQQTFNGIGDTAAMTFDVPADAISFMVDAKTNLGATLGLRLLEGPGAVVFENESLTGPYIWRPNEEVFTVMVPNSDRPAVQLVPGGGTYKLKLMLYQGFATSVDVRVIIERRPTAGTEMLGTLDLNVFLADAIAPTAATAASDGTLQTVIQRMDTILGQQGIQIGDIDYYDINSTTYDDVTWAEFGPMLATSSAAAKERLNLFFVRTAIGGGILGVSAGLGGTALNGTSQSGVMSLYSTSNPSFIGLVAGHELCHYLGLAHTVEQHGSHDDMLDTANCPATGTDSICPTAGGGYLMHWQAVGGQVITAGQGLVIRGHPHLAPTSLSAAPLQALLGETKPVVMPEGISEHWCGTCNQLHTIKGR